MADKEAHADVRPPDRGKAHMGKDWRPVHGPRPIAALIPVVTRAAFRHRMPGAYQLLEAWSGIVGPELAAVTMPRRLFRQTLTIHCLGPVAMELQHVSNELIGRINQYLGSQGVQRLRFLQTLAPRAIPPSKSSLANPSLAKSAVTAAMETTADAAVAAVPEGPLRAALASLGRAVLAEAATRSRS